MRTRLYLAASVVAVAAATGGCANTAADEATSDAVRPSPRASVPASESPSTVASSASTSTPAASAPPPQPVPADVYGGTLTVDEDSSRAPDASGTDSLRGSTFDRTVTFTNCGTASTCRPGHETFAIYDDAPPVTGEWTWVEAADEWVGTLVVEIVDDCVDTVDFSDPLDDVVVGEFQTTITETLVLRDPVEVDNGSAIFSTAMLSYVEDAVSDDVEVGCYSSRYAASGQLAPMAP